MIFENYKFVLKMPAYGKATGSEISLAEIMKEGDSWTFERKNNRTGEKFSSTIIKHYKVQEIRRLAGLKIVKEPTLIVSPTIENGMTAAFAGALQLPNKHNKPDLVIGEANKANTQIDYIVSMAYKRWYDRAVLDCMEMYEAYSEIEAEAFDQDSVGENDAPELTDLEDTEIKVISPFVQSMNSMKDVTMLVEYAKGLKPQLEAAKVSEKARKVLQGLYQRKLEELNGKQF